MQPTCLLHVGESQQDADLCADGLHLPVMQSISGESESPSVAQTRCSHACFYPGSHCTPEMEKCHQDLKALQVGEVLSGFYACSRPQQVEVEPGAAGLQQQSGLRFTDGLAVKRPGGAAAELHHRWWLFNSRHVV